MEGKERAEELESRAQLSSGQSSGPVPGRAPSAVHSESSAAPECLCSLWGMVCEPREAPWPLSVWVFWGERI